MYCPILSLQITWQFPSTSKELRVPSSLPAALFKCHTSLCCSDIAVTLCWGFCHVQRQKTSLFGLPLVPVLMMLHTHHKIRTAFCIFILQPSGESTAGCVFGWSLEGQPFCTFHTVKRIKASSLLRRSLCLNAFILLNFRVCSCTKPLLWSEHSSRDFQWNSSTRWGFLCRKGKKNFFKVTWSLLKALLPMETVKYLDVLLVFIQVFWGSEVNIPKCHLIPSSSLDFKVFQMI